MSPISVHQLSDAETIFYGSGDGSGSYIRAGGGAGVVQTLAVGTWLESDPYIAGESDQVLLLVSATLAPGQTVKLQFELERTDSRNPSFYTWCALPFARLDQGQPAIEHELTPADFLGPVALEVRSVALVTTDLRLTGRARVLVTVTQAPIAADVVMIGVKG